MSEASDPATASSTPVAQLAKRRGRNDQPSKREHKVWRNTRATKRAFTAMKHYLGVDKLSSEQRSMVAHLITPLDRFHD